IPHGIPDVPFVDPYYYKDQFGVEGKKVLLTFGLLSPSKGIEYMVQALPRVLEKHPDTVYIILGATHPNEKKESGEKYRISLQQLARKLGVDKNLIFHNRFVSLQELCEFLGCAEIYVTPYLNKNQIVSGTLAYAMGTGKAVVSTPYFYAEEMLSDGRGRLVPFADSSALAREVNHLLDNQVQMNSMRKRAYLYCRNMVWKEVARQYLEVFAQLKKERQKKPRVIGQQKGLESLPRELPEIKLDYLNVLTDSTGILQHAKFTVPNRLHGYTTDDNARGLIAVLTAQDVLLQEELLEVMAGKYLSFLGYAFNKNTGRFCNFMTFQRTWMEEIGSEDSHGRALWGLGTAVALSKQEGHVAMATSLFESSLAAFEQFNSLRAWAFTLMGISAYRKRFYGDSSARRVERELSERIYNLYKDNADRQWPWPEEVLTYANAKIPHALILAGKDLEREEIMKAGLKMLDWLCKIQKDPAGHFVPIGNHGWYNKNGSRSRFDQQPIEAEAMVGALCAAYEATGDERWIVEANNCFDWFIGRNDHQAPLYDYITGGCRDGLTAEGLNQNEGAESTLAWLLSLITMYTLREIRTISMAEKTAEKKNNSSKSKKAKTYTGSRK
ncbi:MAG: glycosyltransferase, partial [Spirochaetota bacterium]